MKVSPITVSQNIVFLGKMRNNLLGGSGSYRKIISPFSSLQVNSSVQGTENSSNVLKETFNDIRKAGGF